MTKNKHYEYDEDGTEREVVVTERHITKDRYGDVKTTFEKIAYKETGNKLVKTQDGSETLYDKNKNVIRSYTPPSKNVNNGPLKFFIIFFVICAILYYFLVTKIP